MARAEGRSYEAEFPEMEEIVVVQVKRIVDMGAYVSLLEYDNQEGMLLLSELSKRRIRSVAKLLRVGRTEICMVSLGVKLSSNVWCFERLMFNLTDQMMKYKTCP